MFVGLVGSGSGLVGSGEGRSVWGGSCQSIGELVGKGGKSVGAVADGGFSMAGETQLEDIRIGG